MNTCLEELSVLAGILPPDHCTYCFLPRTPLPENQHLTPRVLYQKSASQHDLSPTTLLKLQHHPHVFPIHLSLNYS